MILKQEQDVQSKIKNYIIGGSVAIILLIIFFGSWYTVSAGERAVLNTWGNPDMQPKSEGLHFKVPMIQSVVKMDVKTLKYETDASAASKDLQIVHTKLAVNYHLSPSTVSTIYKEIGVDYQTKIIQPAVQEVVKQVTAQFTAEELITKREIVKEKIDQVFKERVIGRGIIIETISITNFDFSEEFNNAIENKVTQEQNALASKNKLEQIKYDALQVVEKAKGDAEAMSIVQKQLSASPTYIEYLAVQNQRIAIDKWDSHLPQVTGGAIPFISLSNTTR